MKDVLIILIILLLLYGGYKGVTLMADYAGSDTVTLNDIAASENDRVNQSAFKESKSLENVESGNESIEKNLPKQKKQQESAEKTNGEKAMEAVRGQRVDAEGVLRSKEEFYKEPSFEEKRPYERKNTAPPPSRPSVNDKDLKDQQTALVQKGKALEGEFADKGPVEKEVYNIETGKKEKIVVAPRSYESKANYLLVAGSFANPDNARNEVNRYLKKGYSDARLVVSDNKMNLVTLGQYASSKKARARAAQIERKGIDIYVKKMK